MLEAGAAESPYVDLLRGTPAAAVADGARCHAAAGRGLPVRADLWRSAEASFVRRFSVMGIAVRVDTNSSLLDDRIALALGRWPSCGAAAPSAHVRLFLHDPGGNLGTRGFGSPLFRVQGPYFMLVSGNTFAFADSDAGFAAAFVTPEMALDARFVSTILLESLVLYLVHRYRRAALHAAAVISNGRCVLLTAPCGVGKSTLTYACLRAGMRVVAEDIVYLDDQSGRAAVWGNPWLLHVPPGSARFFPELLEVEPVRELSGKLKCLVDVEERWPGGALPHSNVDAILMLARSQGATSRIAAADRDCVRETLTHFRHDVDAGGAAAMAAAADRLTELPMGRLDVGSDLGEAVRAIERWLAR